MKKLLCFCLLFVTMTKLAFGQDYYQPATDKNLYGNHFYISLQDADNVRLDADEVSQYVIAGYIGDECRAAAEFVSTPGGTYVAVLKVNGESDDAGKDIKFRLYNNVSKIEYELPDTYKFTGSDATIGTPSSPILLTIVPVTGLTVSGLDTEGKLTIHNGENINLTELVSIVPADHTPIINNSVTYKASTDCFSVNPATGILTALKSTEGASLTIGLANTKSGQQTTIAIECTVKVIEDTNPITALEISPITVGLNRPSKLEIKYKPESATFSPSRLSLVVTKTRPTTTVYPERWEFVNYLGDGNIVGRTLGDFTVKAYYGPQDEPNTVTDSFTVQVLPEYDLSNGWNWFSIYVANDEVYNLIANHDKFIEARSETQLIYNDPEVGLFGDLTDIEPGKGYKLKVSANVENLRINTYDYWSNLETEQTIHKYWNWIGTPYQYDYNLAAAIIGDFSPNPGDRIVGQEGFAEYVESDDNETEEGWTGSLTVLKAGHAYLLYTTSEDTLIEWSSPSRLAQPAYNEASETRMRDESNIWSYDKHAFLNNMSIVAVSDYDVEANPERYSIGAFVGDVCRGEGTFVEGRWFITVHGENKETVSFRLYDKMTGEITQLDKTLRFSIGAGTVANPIEIESGTTTSIRDVNTSSETICFGNGEILFSSDAEGTVGIYDLSGRAVITQSAASGSVTTSTLPAGTYIVRVKTAAGIVSKKFMK